MSAGSSGAKRVVMRTRRRYSAAVTPIAVCTHGALNKRFEDIIRKRALPISSPAPVGGEAWAAQHRLLALVPDATPTRRPTRVPPQGHRQAMGGALTCHKALESGQRQPAR